MKKQERILILIRSFLAEIVQRFKNSLFFFLFSKETRRKRRDETFRETRKKKKKETSRICKITTEQSKTSITRFQDRSLRVFTRIQCKSAEQCVETNRRGEHIRDARKKERKRRRKRKEREKKKERKKGYVTSSRD